MNYNFTNRFANLYFRENDVNPLSNRESASKNQFSLSVAKADEIIEEIVLEYRNPAYRKWYLKVLYDFGPQKVHEWRRRAAEGKEPGKLFTKLVNEYRQYSRLINHE